MAMPKPPYPGRLVRRERLDPPRLTITEGTRADTLVNQQLGQRRGGELRRDDRVLTANIRSGAEVWLPM